MQPDEIWLVEFRHRFIHCHDFDRTTETSNGALFVDVKAGGSRRSLMLPTGPVRVLLRDDTGSLRDDVVLGPGC